MTYTLFFKLIYPIKKINPKGKTIIKMFNKQNPKSTLYTSTTIYLIIYNNGGDDFFSLANNSLQQLHFIFATICYEFLYPSTLERYPPLNY
jgi:hypothetical protein